MDFFYLLPVLLPAYWLAGYAEIHFRVPWFFSRIFRPEPEILFDAPVRNPAGEPVPVILIFHDTHIFPVVLDSVTVLASRTVPESRLSFTFQVQKPVSTRHQEFHFEIQLPAGKWDLLPSACLNGSGGTREIVVDNLPRTGKNPLQVLVDQDPFPKFENQFHGDLHHHTSYTSDQVEFGATPAASQRMAKAVEFDFLCLTDHSYDLDDDPSDFLKQDPGLQKWKGLLEETGHLNLQPGGPLLIPGFELSTGNSRMQNVHLLLLGQRSFIYGTGDGGERGFKNRPDTAIRQALSLRNPGSAVFAAHPFEQPGLAEKLLLNRGAYTLEDTRIPGLNLQILNGWYGDEFLKSRSLWIRRLLEGDRVFIGGGNDSHGNFNRVRQIKIPFLYLSEKTTHWFGKYRTVVQADCLTEPEILTSLQNGSSYVTNGVAIRILDESGKEIRFGSCQNAKTVHSWSFQIKTTESAGQLSEFWVFYGVKGREIRYSLKTGPVKEEVSEGSFAGLHIPEGAEYLRLEVYGTAGGVSKIRVGDPLFALTNPVFFSIQPAGSEEPEPGNG